MKVTPLDLKKADFKRGMRGYDPGEVQELLASAADSMEELVRENRDLKEKRNQLAERLKSYESMEKTLNDTLITAQKAGETTRQAAEREAELIVARAEVQAEKLVEGAKSELKHLKHQLEMLEHEKQAFLVKMRSLVASQWKLLQEDFEPRRESIESDIGGQSGDKPEPASGPAPEPGASKLDSSPHEEDEDLPQDPVVRERAQEEPEYEKPLEDEPPEAGDLSSHLGRILRSERGERSADEEPEAQEEDADRFFSGADEEEDGESAGEDKPEVFWGDEGEEDREK